MSLYLITTHPLLVLSYLFPHCKRRDLLGKYKWDQSFHVVSKYRPEAFTRPANLNILSCPTFLPASSAPEVPFSSHCFQFLKLAVLLPSTGHLQKLTSLSVVSSLPSWIIFYKSMKIKNTVGHVMDSKKQSLYPNIYYLSTWTCFLL